MLESLLEAVPLWVFIVAGVALIGAMAVATFVAGLVQPWIFWLLLGALVIGGVAGALQPLGGGV